MADDAQAEVPAVRCLRCHWPAFRTVTVTCGTSVHIRGPVCRSCLDSIQQDGRYFTATIQIGPVITGAEAAGRWHGAVRPRTLTQEERGRLIYQVAADVGHAVAAVAGWETERSGVCIAVRFKGHGPRRHGDRADYFIWVEDAVVDLHLHKSDGFTAQAAPTGEDA